MCQDHGLLLFVEPKRFRDFISAGSQSMHMVCEQKHAHLLQSLKKKNIINIPSGKIRVKIMNVKIKVGIINIYKGSGEFATFMYMVYRVLKWMHNYIAYICLTFLHPVFSYMNPIFFLSQN